jgi:hypothetical protein
MIGHKRLGCPMAMDGAEEELELMGGAGVRDPAHTRAIGGS